MTQEECWEFFAENMAPFSSSQSVSVMSNCFGATVMHEQQAKDLLLRFFRALTICLNDVETYKVNILTTLNIPFETVLFLVTIIITTKH